MIRFRTTDWVWLGLIAMMLVFLALREPAAWFKTNPQDWVIPNTPTQNDNNEW
jgi:hypothetical protein